MENPIVSFVILDIKNHYLAPLTIESILNQKEKRYEIIVLAKDILPQDFENLKDFSEFLRVLKHTKKQTHSEIMNEGVNLAKGKYVSFLFPGEVCISRYSLKYAIEKIEEKKYPDLLCFFFLKRDIETPPEVNPVSFSMTLFGEERFPVFARDCLFSKKKLKTLKGFDKRYHWLESFDMVIRIFLKRGRIVCCRRVFADYELQKHMPKDALSYLKELVAVIYRNFGVLRLFHFYVIREFFDTLVSWVKGIKRYFVQN
jgi:hypothetical protein